MRSFFILFSKGFLENMALSVLLSEPEMNQWPLKRSWCCFKQKNILSQKFLTCILWQCLPLHQTIETPTPNPHSMWTVLSLDEEVEITLKEVDEVDSITPTSTLRISTHSQIKETLSFHRNLKDPGLSAKFVVNLVIKLLIVTIKWILHTMADIPLPS